MRGREDIRWDLKDLGKPGIIVMQAVEDICCGIQRALDLYQGGYVYILAMKYMALCGHLGTHDGKHDRIDRNLPKTTACCVAFASNLVLATPTLTLA